MATVVGRILNMAVVSSMAGSGGVCIWRESGILVFFFLVCLAWSSASRHKDLFTYNLVYKIAFYEFCDYFQCDLQR